jgi:hypothetical protein
MRRTTSWSPQDRGRSGRSHEWRRLEPGGQALLALAHLRNGDTCTRLAAGFEIGIATAWRYVQEAIALLSAATDDLDTAMRRIRALAYAILDGTLIPIDRVADQKPYYSGKHKRHGVNRPGHRRRGRTAHVGLTSPARFDARPDRRPNPRHHRRVDERRRHGLRGQDIRWV